MSARKSPNSHSAGGWPKCSRRKCNRPAFRETNPPRCLQHSGGAHKWYARVCERDAKKGAELHGSYVAICLDPIAHSFFDAHYKRRQAGRHVKFKFADIVFWIASAAGAGIVQGVAYDVLKDIVQRVLRSQKDKSNVEFTRVIIKSEYTERLQRRKKRDADLEEVERTLEERYDLIVRKGGTVNSRWRPDST